MLILMLFYIPEVILPLVRTQLAQSGYHHYVLPHHHYHLHLHLLYGWYLQTQLLLYLPIWSFYLQLRELHFKLCGVFFFPSWQKLAKIVSNDQQKFCAQKVYSVKQKSSWGLSETSWTYLLSQKQTLQNLWMPDLQMTGLQYCQNQMRWFCFLSKKKRGKSKIFLYFILKKCIYVVTRINWRTVYSIFSSP